MLLTNRRLVMGLAGVSLAACCSLDVQAAAIGDFQFNTLGDTEGWTARANSSLPTGFEADGDSLNGTATGNDPIIEYFDDLTKASTANWTTIVLRVRETGDVNGQAGTSNTVPFNATGVLAVINEGGSPTSGILTVNSFVDSGDGFFTVTYDISGFTADTIDKIRIDPIGGASSNSNSQTTDNFFEIDFIQVNDDSVIPEPASLSLLGLGMLAMIRRRR